MVLGRQELELGLRVSPNQGRLWGRKIFEDCKGIVGVPVLIFLSFSLVKMSSSTLT